MAPIARLAISGGRSRRRGEGAAIGDGPSRGFGEKQNCLIACREVQFSFGEGITRSKGCERDKRGGGAKTHRDSPKVKTRLENRSGARKGPTFPYMGNTHVHCPETGTYWSSHARLSLSQPNLPLRRYTNKREDLRGTGSSAAHRGTRTNFISSHATCRVRRARSSFECAAKSWVASYGAAAFRTVCRAVCTRVQSGGQGSSSRLRRDEGAPSSSPWPSARRRPKASPASQGG